MDESQRGSAFKSSRTEMMLFQSTLKDFENIKSQNDESVDKNFLSLNELMMAQAKKILIVDDEQYNIDAIEIILEHICGIEVEFICT